MRTHAPDVTTTDGAPNARGHRDEPTQRGPAATATRTSCQLGPRPPPGSKGTAGEIQRTSLQTLSYTDKAHPGLAAPRFSQNHSVSRSYPAGLRRSPRGTLLLIPTPRRWTGRALTGHGDMHFLASPGGYSGLAVPSAGLWWMRTTADRLMTDLAVRRTVAASATGLTTWAKLAGMCCDRLMLAPAKKAGNSTPSQLPTVSSTSDRPRPAARRQ